MEPPRNDAVLLDSAEKTMLQWNSTPSEEAGERMIFDGDSHDSNRYLQAVFVIQRSMESAAISSSSSYDDQKNPKGAILIAMARLEDEFRNILTAQTSPVEADYLNDPSTLSLVHSAVSSWSSSSKLEINLNFPDDEKGFENRCQI